MLTTIPPILHIVGRKNAGKTDLIMAMIRGLAARGYRVAAVRHSPHEHSVDSEGADTARYRQAGALGSALISARETCMFFSAAQWDEKLQLCARGFGDCHIMLVEGGMQNGREKIEVVPAGAEPLCSGDPELRAFVSGKALPEVPCYRPDDTESLCAFVEQRYLRPRLSVAVMAGGKSSRLGRNKALLSTPNGTVIEHVLKTAFTFADQVKIITNSPEEYRHLELETISDLRPGCGPMSGIHTALATSPTEYVLIVSCDIPLVGPPHLHPLVSGYPGTDITLYKHKNFEPLCAIYRRSCIPALEDLIEHDEYRIIDLFPTLQVNVLRTDDTELFTSINTEDDYRYVLKKISD
ncbi:molybdopterin-guanine dinucleotide biosynthesis protein B [Thermodesulfobacteriota bacterium]